jgi:hypothetical protein
MFLLVQPTSATYDRGLSDPIVVVVQHPHPHRLPTGTTSSWGLKLQAINLLVLCIPVQIHGHGTEMFLETGQRHPVFRCKSGRAANFILILTTPLFFPTEIWRATAGWFINVRRSPHPMNIRSCIYINIYKKMYIQLFLFVFMSDIWVNLSKFEIKLVNVGLGLQVSLQATAAICHPLFSGGVKPFVTVWKVRSTRFYLL